MLISSFQKSDAENYAAPCTLLESNFKKLAVQKSLKAEHMAARGNTSLC